MENHLGLSMTRLESKVDKGHADMEGKMSNTVGLRHWAGSGLLSTQKPIISDEGPDKIDLVLRFIFGISICQV